MPEPKKATEPVSMEAALKALVEGIHPDLRPHMRLTLLGKVVAVYEDDYRVDVVIGDPTSDSGQGSGLALPRVPVNSIWAQDGYGVWALPEVDSEVSISFYEGDVTQPYVEASTFYQNKAPGGFKAGAFAIRGKQGQKIEFKPEANEVVISAASIKVVNMGAWNQYTADAHTCEVGGESAVAIGKSRLAKVGAVDALEARARVRKISGASDEEHGSLKVRVRGAVERRVAGNEMTTIGGNNEVKVLGSALHAAAGHRKEIVGGAWNVLVANGPIPSPDAISLKAAMGNISINTMLGLIRIGGDTAVSPAVLGLELVAQLTALVQVISVNAAAFTAPVVVGAPAQLNPAVVAALQGWAAGLAAVVLSKAVFIKALPAG